MLGKHGKDNYPFIVYNYKTLLKFHDILRSIFIFKNISKSRVLRSTMKMMWMEPMKKFIYSLFLFGFCKNKVHIPKTKQNERTKLVYYNKENTQTKKEQPLPLTKTKAISLVLGVSKWKTWQTVISNCWVFNEYCTNCLWGMPKKA